MKRTLHIFAEFRCQIVECAKMVVGNSGPTNLMKHLRKHERPYAEFEKKENEHTQKQQQSVSMAAASQTKMSDHVI